MKLRSSGFALIGIIAALAFVPGAYATVELKLDDGAGHSVDITENCGTGCVSFNGGLGDWNINVTTGISADGQSPIMDLNSVDHHCASAKGSPVPKGSGCPNPPSDLATTLKITLSDDGFTTTAPQFKLMIGGTVGANGTVTAALFGATTDTKFDTTNQIGSTLTFNGGVSGIAFSTDEVGNAATVYPYALTEQATITFGKKAGQASFNYSVDAIPEPTGVVLLGGVLLATVSAIRRKARRA